MFNNNGLKKLKELKILNLSFNYLTDNNISIISFTNNNNKIEVLNLKLNQATEINIEIFKNELIKLNNLKELNFLDNQFCDQGLNQLLQVFNTVKYLYILIISNFNISILGIVDFANFLKNRKIFAKIGSFELISNPINEECLSSFIYIIKNLVTME